MTSRPACAFTFMFMREVSVWTIEKPTKSHFVAALAATKEGFKQAERDAF
jgi:hypothetical protein